MNLINQISILASSSTISDEEVPLSIFTGTWAVGNLIIMLLTVFEALILILLLRNASKEREKIKNMPPKNRDVFHAEYRREKTYAMLSLPIAAISIAEYFFTEDISMEMVLFDRYTILMALFLALQTGMVIAFRRKILHITE